MFSCYKDKSNVVITEINHVNMNDFNEEVYKLIAFKDTLKIAPVITSKHNNLEYFWGYYNKNNSYDGTGTALDTICYEKNLIYPIKLTPGNYKLVFCVKDVETGVSVYKYANLSVETRTSRGWFILKDKDGFSDLDLFNETGILTNIISRANNGRRLEGKGLRIGFTARYSYLNRKKLKIESNIKCLIPMTESDVSVIRISNIEELNNHEGLFYYTPGTSKPTFFIDLDKALLYANNGKSHFIPYPGKKHSGKFGNEHFANHEYYLSKYFAVRKSHYYMEAPTVFDELESSFYQLGDRYLYLYPYQDRYSPYVPVTTHYSTRNLNSDLLYMGSKKGGTGWRPQGLGIALLKKRSTQDTLLLTHLNLTSNNMYRYWSFRKNPLFRMDTIPSNSKLATADLYALNKDFNLLYYTKDNKISYYDIESKQEEAIYSLASGEKITYIRHSKYNVDIQVDDDYNFDKLVIASYSGGKYKVYLFNMLAGKPKGDPIIMEGEGRVADVIYISPQLEYYNY
jgi:hypothetical protein